MNREEACFCFCFLRFILFYVYESSDQLSVSHVCVCGDQEGALAPGL